MWSLVYCKKIKVYIGLRINKKTRKVIDFYLRDLIRQSVQNLR